MRLTKKSLQTELRLDPNTAREVWALLKGTKPHEAFRSIDKLLRHHGLEAIWEGEDVSYYDCGISFCPRYTYSNTGDSYALTIVRDHKRKRWLLTSWADLFGA